MSIAGLGSIILIVSIIAALVLAGVIVIIVLAANRKKKAQQPQPAPVPQVPPIPVPQTPPVPANQVHTQPHPAITAGIARNALRFMGLYEGIYTNVTTPETADPGAYREWHIRMQNLRHDREFYDVFCQQFPRDGVTPAHMDYLLLCIFASGIRRGTEHTHTATTATREAYVYLGAGPICPGTQYTVVRPCWTLNGQTVEQGILAPKES